jgi:Cof subfamily protein (haloacid dehalogenase superfamily)
MIAIDLDGTLLSPEGKVTPRTRDAIHRARAHGLKICFATGRNLTESRAVLKEVDHHDAAVFVGGAMVIDPATNLTLHRTLLPHELAAELCEALEGRGHAVLALQDTHAAGVDYFVSNDFPLNAATDHWLKVTKATVKLLPKLTGVRHEHTIRIGIVAPRGEAQDLQKEIIERFGERVFCLVLRVPAAGVDVLEVFDASVNKWAGVMAIAQRHAIKAEQVIAVGDDVNDVPMFKFAGLSLAMGQASDEVKQQAHRVIASNRDDGLAQFLEEFVASHAAIVAA